MNFLDRTLSIFGYTKGAQLDNPPRFVSAHAGAERFWEPNPWTIEAQIYLYTKVSAITTATHIVATACASTSSSVKELSSDDKFIDVDNHAFESLLEKPNPDSDRYSLIYDTISWRIITGNCYWWLNRPSPKAPPTEIWIIPPNMIRPVPDERMFVRGYMYNAGNGVEIPIDSDEICHFKSFHPKNMFVGMSDLESIEVTAYLDQKANEWNRNFFARDNAKPTGVMAFSSPVDTHKWEQIKQDVRREYGGANRKLMMLNGVGQGAINFIPTMLSQSDMQFLDTRDFNRKEIFDRIAPGGESMLNSSSNVATSQTGKDSFFGLAVYPRQAQLAGKINNDLMPMYGEGLKYGFDDVRQRDIKLELEQIGVYAATHTVNETRARWYDSEPIGDDRGELLIAEITQSAQPVEPSEVSEEPLPETPEQDSIEESLKAALAPLIDEVKALKTAQPATQPTTVTINQSAPIEAEYHVAGEEPAEQITGPTKAEDDLSLWRKKASNKAKKGKLASVPFESEWLSTAVKAFVSSSLEHGDIEHTFAAAKLLLQLDPDDDEAERDIRMGVEAAATERISKALSSQKKDVVASARDGEVATIPRDGKVRDALRAALIDSVDLGVAVAIVQLENVGIGFDWTLANSEAREWANQYAGQLITDINSTTQRQVQQAVSEWIDNGSPLVDLVKELERTFGRQRAELIAATEVTKAYARGSQQGYIESGVVEAMEWRTVGDELVCAVCGPKNGKRLNLTVYSDELPPAHPRCRCFVSPVGDGRKVRTNRKSTQSDGK